jgi:CBS domain-containing protein
MATSTTSTGATEEEAVDAALDAQLGGAGATRVGVLASDGLARVASDVDLRHVAAALVQEGVGAVVVVDGERVHGVLSERDVVLAVATGTDVDAVLASQVDSRDLVACTPDTTVDEAAQLLMEHYVRHLVVEDDSGPVGVVSARDLLGVYSA